LNPRSHQRRVCLSVCPHARGRTLKVDLPTRRWHEPVLSLAPPVFIPGFRLSPRACTGTQTQSRTRKPSNSGDPSRTLACRAPASSPRSRSQTCFGCFDLAVGDLHGVPSPRAGRDGRDRDVGACVPAADRRSEDPASGLVPEHLDAGQVRLDLLVNPLQCARADTHGQAAGSCVKLHRSRRALDRAHRPRTYDRRSGCCCTWPRRDAVRARRVLVAAVELLDVAGRSVDCPFQPVLLATTNQACPHGLAVHSRKRCVRTEAHRCRRRSRYVATSLADQNGPHASRATGCGKSGFATCLRVFCFEMPNVSASSWNPRRCVPCIYTQKSRLRTAPQESRAQSDLGLPAGPSHMTSQGTRVSPERGTRSLRCRRYFQSRQYPLPAEVSRVVSRLRCGKRCCHRLVPCDCGRNSAGLVQSLTRAVTDYPGAGTVIDSSDVKNTSFRLRRLIRSSGCSHPGQR
jgi:hypothetical protein